MPVCKNQHIECHKYLSDIAIGEIVNTILSNGHMANIRIVEQIAIGLHIKSMQIIIISVKTF